MGDAHAGKGCVWAQPFLGRFFSEPSPGLAAKSAADPGLYSTVPLGQ